MRSELSILIPVFNAACFDLVRTLRNQCEALSLPRYEIWVLDDCSTSTEHIRINQCVNDWPHCHFVMNEQNLGRAATRNKLASMASFKWLLYIDGDMSIAHSDYIRQYMNQEESWTFVYGGYKIGGDFRENLRWNYEKKYVRGLHRLQKQGLFAHKQFCSCNFLIEKEILICHPFDEHIKQYGYEDLLFAGNLYSANIPIFLCDNPVIFSHFESNEAFIQKTEEALRNLKTHEKDLKDYSLLLKIVCLLEKLGLNIPLGNMFKMGHKAIRHALINKKPNLYLLYWYKLGYYLSYSLSLRHSNSVTD
ncbi:glycosyltransferase family 2 protein [Prevotella sp. A2931]|uniref:Glycosyltransferase family 2 protein n=1 Tax=Prevotella illustrans TaxID=2800387 RepID=A0ABS3M2E9_9BACT|nr:MULTISPECIES: glycosyltransferase family 2 protein [Prevotella]MBO1362368.1 glycosyltransferase family 2 protein [Prevotella illustrans]PTL25112.1 glycosyltransferase family 2 protein [Prevotella sp. oral taxon 820]